MPTAVGSGLGALGRPGASRSPGCGPQCLLFAAGPVLPPSPPAASPPPPAAWEIFPMEACPSPPYFNKSMEEGQGIPPGSSYTSQPVPHLLCPPSLAWPGKAAGSQALAGGGVGAQPMPSPATPSFHTSGQAGAYRELLLVGTPIQVLGRECLLGPPATLERRSQGLQVIDPPLRSLQSI